jgi:hypothetical protein
MKGIMKLTYRQKTFLSQLLDVYREMQEPIHYSIVAKRLGLDNSTSYDMFRLLEKKGMVRAEYGTPKENSGPGRSNILFLPTTEAIELFSHLAGNISEQHNWDDVKAHILADLGSGKADDCEDILSELLSRIPQHQSPLVQCAQTITALLLNLREVKQELAEQSSVDNLLRAPVSKLRMSILAGLILGLSHADKETQRLLCIYQEYAEKYEASLQELNRDSLLKLHRFTCDIWNILKTPAG